MQSHDLLQESGAIHAGHPHVGDDDIHRALLHEGQGLRAARCDMDIPTLLLPFKGERVKLKEAGFVINEKDAFLKTR